MARPHGVSEASVYRLSLYHCYVGELIRTGPPEKILSRQIAADLNIKDETVRRDLSFVGGVGRPGSGYDAMTLFTALQTFLGLKDQYPIVRIGTAQMLEALSLVFPPESWGVRPVAYFSEDEADTGKHLGGIEIRPLCELPELDSALEVDVALVACSPARVEESLALLSEAGVTGVLLLTPALRLTPPEGMTVTHVRMPCDIKSLACTCGTRVRLDDD